MSQDPFNKDHHLCTKLDEYHIDIPDFPMKSNRWERFINLLASPAKDPIDPLISTTGGLMLLKIAPIIGTAALALIQALIFL
ncbi:hypothetical protein ACFFF5_08850 [Lederbergia wuyishanensis]|uniref:Uncharacterized protein n=1 Tax=Lederbergia wuyishanensis TaxID=1347903 RepID=A0ABU0D653_9BACI|nr:hypothetical protein [Lederbergia wuyishanensis]MCJ8008711.1 hypothetical protein [Lederbergia wuyishanensis]MDQ0343870.1 hypothetical protein [Lederbergia wuyishanensis]